MKGRIADDMVSSKNKQLTTTRGTAALQHPSLENTSVDTTAAFCFLAEQI
jgi:hypothetical protein